MNKKFSLGLRLMLMGAASFTLSAFMGELVRGSFKFQMLPPVFIGGAFLFLLTLLTKRFHIFGGIITIPIAAYFFALGFFSILSYTQAFGFVLDSHMLGYFAFALGGGFMFVGALAILRYAYLLRRSNFSHS